MMYKNSLNLLQIEYRVNNIKNNNFEWYCQYLSLIYSKNGTLPVCSKCQLLGIDSGFCIPRCFRGVE